MLDRDPWSLSVAPPPGPSSERAFAETRLHRAVVWCELAPGAVVSETDLVERFGLNRAGVRAGLVALESRGLVEALPRHGWRIRPITGILIGDVVASRRLLESGLVLAPSNEAKLGRIAEIAQMSAVLAGRPEPAARDSLRSYDRELLEILFDGLGDIRRRWLAEVWDHCDRLVRFFEADGTHRLAPVDRRPLARACRAGDETAARTHLAEALGHIEAFFVAGLLARETAIDWPGETRTKRRTDAARPARRAAAPSEKPLQPKRTV
jgi:DNA-binding GntR family transcriptional regulator